MPIFRGFPIDLVLGIVNAQFLITFCLLVFLWRKIIENLFVRDEEQQTEKIRKYNNLAARSLHLDEILAETVEIIQETVESANIYICIQEHGDGDYQARYSNQPLNDLFFTIRKDNPLIRILERNDGVLMREFQTMIGYKSMWESEKRSFQDLKIEACVGLRDKEKIVGVVLLSNPPGNRKISRTDIDMALTIASSASIAIKNARLYETACYEARTDEPTKLLNRKYFFEILNEEFEANLEGSLAIINIDDFKLYNQLYGTQAGDNALRRIAEIIKNSVGDSGYVARYSGKEFAVLLPKYDVFSARNLVKSIQKQIWQADSLIRNWYRSLSVE